MAQNSSSSAEWAHLPGKPLLDVQSFRLEIPTRDVLALKTLLELSRVQPKTYENQQNDRRFGITQEWMLNAVDVWKNRYDWSTRQKAINRHPQFTTSLDDDGETYKLHFAALCSKRQDAIPLCFMHGWPGSFLEFYPILDIIRTEYRPETSPYHIIVPSLPGYNMSSGPPLEKDFGLLDCARVIDLLMTGLGFGEGYALQGGDIGAMMIPVMAKSYPERVQAFHVNFVAQPKPAEFPDPVDDLDLTERDREKIARADGIQKNGLAWAPLQATRPATVGTVLNSNPVSLLAWIGEKMLAWTDSAKPLSLETILDHVTLYWFTDSIARNLWAYRSMFTGVTFVFMGVTQPFGYSRFPYDLDKAVQKWVAAMSNLKFFKDQDSGGHFAALEEPKALWGDIEEFMKGSFPDRFQV